MSAQTGFFNRLYASKAGLYVVGRWLLVLALAVVAAKSIQLGCDALAPDLVAKKDLLQDWLMVQAHVHEDNPYAEVSELRSRYLPELDTPVFNHPSPHTPQSILFFAPFSRMSYRAAAEAWLFLEIVFTVAAGALAARICFDRPSGRAIVVAVLLVLSSTAVQESFISGTLSPLLFLLAGCIVFAWTRQRLVLLGIALGTCWSLKLFGIPLGVYLLWKRAFSPLMIAGIVFLLTICGAAAFLGTDVVVSYWSQVIPALSRLYRADEFNQSVLTVGQRLFIGVFPAGKLTVAAPPLLAWPEAEPFVRGAIAAAFFVTYFIRFARCNDERIQIAGLLCVSTLGAPIVWIHGLIVFVFPIFLLFRVLAEREFPSRPTLCTLAAVLLFLVGNALRVPVIGSAESVSFLRSLVSWIPMVNAVVLLELLLRTEKRSGVILEN